LMRKRRTLTPEMDETEPEPTEPRRWGKETCMNPWNGECSNTDISLYIMYKGRRLPICWECWGDISSKNIEWTYD